MPEISMLIAAIVGIALIVSIWCLSLNVQTAKGRRIRLIALVCIALLAAGLSTWVYISLSTVQDCIEWFIMSSC